MHISHSNSPVFAGSHAEDERTERRHAESGEDPHLAVSTRRGTEVCARRGSAARLGRATRALEASTSATCARQHADFRRAGLNHEYACQGCPDEKQLQETVTAPHGSHLLSPSTRTFVSLLILKRQPHVDSYEWIRNLHAAPRTWTIEAGAIRLFSVAVRF